VAVKADIVLKDADRQKLDSIVGQMVSNKEPDDNIKFVVEDFKSKYGVKKKDQIGAPSANGTENTSPSELPLTSDQVANNVFSFDKFRTKKAPLPANLKQTAEDIGSVVEDINIGTTTPKQLSNLYNNANGRELIKKAIEQYTPDLGQYGWEPDIYRNEKKWETLSKNINAANRINALGAEAKSVEQLDGKIKELAKPYNTYSMVEGAVVPKENMMLSDIDLNDDKEISNTIAALRSKDFTSVGESGYGNEVSNIEQSKVKKELENKRDAAVKLLKERLFYNKTNQDIDPEIKERSDKIKTAVTSVNMARERGENVKPEDYVLHDAANADHFEIGLNYIKDENPSKYENIVRAIDKKGKIADGDFRDVSRIGQDIKNQQVFRAAAHDPELIDKETDLDYTTYQDKKAIAAGAIGDWLKDNGYKNYRQFPSKLIKQAASATGVANKDIVNDLVNEEGILGYDAIPKSGGVEAVARGFMQPFSGIESTIQDLRNDDATNYLRTQQYDVGIGGQKIPNKKGEISSRLASDRGNLWYDALEGFGQFIPQILLTKGIGGAAAGVLGADARIALTAAQKANITTYGGTFISTYLQEYGNAYEQALQTTGDPVKAKAMGAINGTAAALFEEILPDTKIADKAADMFRKGGFADDVIDLIKKGGNPEDIARKGKPIIEKFVNEVINTTHQEVKEEVGTQLVNYITEGIFSPKTAKDRDLAKELFETAKATAVSMILPAFFGGAGVATHKSFTVNGLHSAAINFEDYKNSLNKALINDQISQDEHDAGIKMISTHRQSIAESPTQSSEGKKLSTSEKLEYAYQETLLKKYNNDLKQTASEVAKEDIQNKVNKAQEIQRQILDLPKAELKEGEKPVKVDNEWKQRIIPFDEESVIEPTIADAANKGNLEGVYGDMVKADPSTANAVILDLAKQKYGIQEDGSESPEGGRDISMKTSLDVDDAVTKLFPDKKSVINQILKPKIEENVNETKDNAEASKEAEGILNQEGAVETTGTEAAPLTKEAEDLLSSIGEGSKPTLVTNNLEKIANDNGIEVTGEMTADDVVNALREKSKVSSEVASIQDENKTVKVPAEQAERVIADKGKSLADKIRKLKTIRKPSEADVLQSSIFGIPMAIYDGAIETVATAIEKGSELAQAIQDGIRYIKDNGGRELDAKGFKEHLEDYAAGEKPTIKVQIGEEDKPKVKVVVGKEDKEKEGDIIDDYEMTTSGEVNKFMSGATIEDVFGDTPEGNQDYEIQKLNDMLNDGRSMINMATAKWGNDVMDYGKPLFEYVQQMSNDKQLSNKKAVLLATFLGELKESIAREPERAGEIRPLNNAVEAYYQSYMNKVGKDLAAGRLLRLYRDKYLGDIFANRILEDAQVKEKKWIQDAEVKKKIDDETAAVDKKITKEEKDGQDKADKSKSKKAKDVQSKKKKLSTDDAKRKAEAKMEEIKNKAGGKKGLIDKINDAIKRLNCK
jgi:hypothetical protein